MWTCCSDLWIMISARIFWRFFFDCMIALLAITLNALSWPKRSVTWYTRANPPWPSIAWRSYWCPSGSTITRGGEGSCGFLLWCVFSFAGAGADARFGEAGWPLGATLYTFSRGARWSRRGAAERRRSCTSCCASACMAPSDCLYAPMSEAWRCTGAVSCVERLCSTARRGIAGIARSRWKAGTSAGITTTTKRQAASPGGVCTTTHTAYVSQHSPPTKL